MTELATRRGTTNGNARGSTEDRRRRREWLVETYRANLDVELVTMTTVGLVDEVVDVIELPLGWRRRVVLTLRHGDTVAESVIQHGMFARKRLR